MCIVIIDTSVLCNILSIPNRNQNHERALTEFEQFVEANCQLFLHEFVLVETGNHISQNGTGDQRRVNAIRFRKLILDSIEKKAPWELIKNDHLPSVAAQFPERAMAGVGLTDAVLIATWIKLTDTYSDRRIKIWSYDEHLAAYDTQVA